MSIARRIAELYEVKMNAVFDRAADPREMVDYSYIQLQELRAWPAGAAAAQIRLCPVRSPQCGVRLLPGRTIVPRPVAG